MLLIDGSDRWFDLVYEFVEVRWFVVVWLIILTLYLKYFRSASYFWCRGFVRYMNRRRGFMNRRRRFIFYSWWCGMSNGNYFGCWLTWWWYWLLYNNR